MRRSAARNLGGRSEVGSEARGSRGAVTRNSLSLSPTLKRDLPTKGYRLRQPPPKADLYERTGKLLREAQIAKGLSQSQLGAPYFTRAMVSAVELAVSMRGCVGLSYQPGVDCRLP